MIYGVLKKSIIEEFGRHFYIFQGQMLREDEIQKFQEILKGEAKPDDYVATLVFLSQCLKKYHNSNVVILIDEYGVFCDYNNTEKRKKPFFNKICSKGGFFMRRPVQWNYAAGAASREDKPFLLNVQACAEQGCSKRCTGRAVSRKRRILLLDETKDKI